MDEATKLEFKWKFYRLAILLNVVVILVAGGVISLVLAPGALSLPLALALFVLAAAMGVYFRNKYIQTRVWLDEHA